MYDLDDHIDGDDDNGTAAAYGDLVTAVLFVFIITLVAYVINFSANQAESQAMGQKVSDIVARKSFIVDKVSHRLDQYGVDHAAEEKVGVIRISSDDLAFEPGSFHLKPNQDHKVNAIARALAAELPCYGMPSAVVQKSRKCGAEQAGQLRSVVVEGHTDNVPLGRPRDGIRDNTDLSLMRASTILKRLLEHPILGELSNGKGQSLLHAAGHGDTRPINAHAVPVSDRENRRIEIRIVVDNPWTH